MPRLVIEKGVDKGKHLAISARGTLLIGRDSSANLRVADTMASRLHFRLEVRADGVWLVDLKSMNGTAVNGTRVQEVLLKPGDRVQVGETLFTYMADDEAQGQDSFVGKLVAGYRVLERVGRGGMGTVYKAEQLSLKRIVALKVISSEHTRDRTFMEMFLREARAAAQLNHPNIVQVYDARGTEGSYFYSMEFVPNGSVQDLLSKETKLPPDRAVRMALDAARGLEYAERKEIVHRDIKPDNLMIGEMEAIKIGDLGLAQSLKDAEKADASGTVLGTPHFIAPEQVLGKPADHRSDIYALGATLYRMLAGTTPFTGDNVREIVQRKVREDPPPLHETDPSIPEPLSALVQRMMARDPAERFQKVSEAVAGLEAFLAAPAASTVAAGGLRRPAVVRAAAGAAAVLVLGLVAALVFRGGPAPPVSAAGGGGAQSATASSAGSGGPSAAEEDLAQEYLRQAKDAEKQLRKDSEESVRKTIAMYERILEKCPRSGRVGEARERIRSLQGALAEAGALRVLREGEQADAEAYRKLAKGARDGPLDAGALRAAVDASAARYEGVERAHPRSAAAPVARRHRDHLREWQARAESALARCAEVEAAARQEAEASHFGAAVSLWRAYQQEHRDKALKSPFEDGRYGELLVDALAEARVRDLEAAAAAAFQQVQQKASADVAQERFDQAKGRYQWAESTFGLPDVTVRARQELAAIDRKIIEKLDRDRREKEEAERRKAEEDGKRLAAAVAALQEPLKRYAFQRAMEAYREAASGLELDRNKAAAARRLEDLEAMARLKAEFMRRSAARGGARDFNRTIKAKGQAGEISGATEEALTITVTVQKGSAELPMKWADFAPNEFCGVFRKRWNMTAPDLFGLGCLFLEYGLFEDAEGAFQQAQAKAPDDAVRGAAARHLDGLRGGAGESAGARALDAERRLQHAKALTAQKHYDRAKIELEVLLQSLGDTEVVRKARAEIEALLQDVTARLKEEEERGRRSEAIQRLQEALAAELREAQGRRREVRDRLRALRDDVDRKLQTALVASAWQEWREAVALYEDVRADVDPKIAQYAADGRGDFAAWLYHAAFRNAVVAADKARADRLFKEAFERLGGVEAWSGWMADALSKWREQEYPAGVQEARRLRAQFEADPANPDTLWGLADLFHDTVPRRLDERQYLRALAALYPDHPRVRDGEALYRLAENCLAFREVPFARALYAKLQEEHPGHPRVKDAEAPGSAARRLRECGELMEKMGWK